MRGYLIDTNIASYYFNVRQLEHGPVRERFSALSPTAPCAISAISLGEIEYGHLVEGSSELTQLFRQFVEQTFPMPLPVDEHTRAHYGKLRANLFERFGPTDRKKRKRSRTEELVDPTTAKVLGVQENDLWIAAQAIQYEMVLVTNDRMTRLREIAEDLLVEDWAESGKTAQ